MTLLVPRGEIEVVDPNQAALRGYAAITGNEFSYFDPYEWRERRMVVDQGAFKSVLERQGGAPLPVYWSHGVLELQLGETLELHEDDKGLFFSALPFATNAVIDQLTVMYGRSRTGASMLFEFGEVAEDDSGLEHIKSFNDLVEVGPTPVGANPAAFAEVIERTELEAQEQDTDTPDDDGEPDPELASEDTNQDAELTATIIRAAARFRRR